MTIAYFRFRYHFEFMTSYGCHFCQKAETIGQWYDVMGSSVAAPWKRKSENRRFVRHRISLRWSKTLLTLLLFCLRWLHLDWNKTRSQGFFPGNEVGMKSGGPIQSIPLQRYGSKELAPIAKSFHGRVKRKVGACRQQKMNEWLRKITLRNVDKTLLGVSTAFLWQTHWNWKEKLERR